jgi:hypothetical protein
MAEDLSKNIIIQVTAQTSQLEQSITNLNKIIDTLSAQQKQLDASGQQNSVTFDNLSSKLEIFQKRLQDVNTQIAANTAALNSLNTTAKNSDGAITSLTTQQQKNAKATGDSATKAKALGTQLNSLNQTLKQQTGNAADAAKSINSQSANMEKGAIAAQQLQSDVIQTGNAFQQQVSRVEQSKTAFDEHKATMDHLKTSFDEVKDVSGIFGPSLQEAAKGFNLMKSGLSVMKDGLTGVGDALKADGFDFLLQVLQMLFDYFIKTSTGTKVLQGAISAIGVVVNKVEGFFKSIMGTIIQAFSHPIDTIKELGRMVEQNIINRFTAFGKILDGLLHLDFKKIADGALQAVTGITNATDKIASTVKTVTDVIAKTGTEIGKAYTDGVNQANNAIDKLNKGTNTLPVAHGDPKGSGTADPSLISQQTSSQPAPDKFPTPKADLDEPNPNETYKDLAVQDKLNQEKLAQRQEEEAKKTTLKIIADAKQIKADNQKKEDEERHAHNKEIEKEAVALAGKIALDALNVLQNSIKQQSEAKISALETQKNAELNNSSLTGAQRIAIEAKFKKQEDQIKLKAFKEGQEASVAQAVINGALAITKGTAQTGVLAALYIPSIIAETAIEIAKIESQKPPAYATGGLHYTSDGRGGVLSGYSRTDNTNAYLRSGEGIVVSEAMRAPWARNLVSAINVGFGGKDFSTTHTGRGYAVGGVFTDGGDANRYYNAPVNDQKNLANTIAYQMVNNFPPVYVDVKDINNQQNILAQTINRVNL